MRNHCWNVDNAEHAISLILHRFLNLILCLSMGCGESILKR